MRNCELCKRKVKELYADNCNNAFLCEDCYARICDEANCLRPFTLKEELKYLFSK